MFTLPRRSWAFLFTLPVVLASLSHAAGSPGVSALTQGIRGRVLFYEGNQMPGPGGPSGSIKPVSRTICLFALTDESQATQVEPCFYSRISTPLVDSTLSGEDGVFEIALPPGRYSLFVKEGDLYYANGFDGEGNIQPVTVGEGRVTEVTIKITYKAAF